MQSPQGIRGNQGGEEFQWSQYAGVEILGAGEGVKELRSPGKEAGELKDESPKPLGGTSIEGEGAEGWEPLERTLAEKKLEQRLLEVDPPDEGIEASWRGELGILIWMSLLSYHGVSLEVIGRWFSVNKSTVYRRIKELCHINLDWITQLARESFSGVCGVDEM